MIPQSLAEKQALSRERQAQIKENKKQMGTNNRREVAKRLKEEIDKTTDPQTLIELSNLLAKMQPKKRRQRKPEAIETVQKSNGGISIMDTPEGSRLDHLEPHGKRVFYWIIRQIEKRPVAERRGLAEKLLESLSEHDRKAFEVYDPKESV
jgi:hypothetical protein